MAIWQFDFSVVPESESVLERFSDNNIDNELSDIDDPRSWNGYCLSQASLDKISEIFQPTKSWSDNIKQFGSLDETCIELLYENDILLEISVRLDLRKLSQDILSAVIDFVRENKALILTRQGVILRPLEEDVIIEIKKSDACSFINNPQEFLSSLNRKNNEI